MQQDGDNLVAGYHRTQHQLLVRIATTETALKTFDEQAEDVKTRIRILKKKVKKDAKDASLQDELQRAHELEDEIFEDAQAAKGDIMNWSQELQRVSDALQDVKRNLARHQPGDNDNGEGADREDVKPRVAGPAVAPRRVKAPANLQKLKYDAEAFSITEYLQTFERCCRSDGVLEKEMGLLLLGQFDNAYLGNKIHLWALETEEQDDEPRHRHWDKMKARMHKELPDVDHRAHYRQQIKDKKRQPQENIATYNTTWQQLADRAELDVDTAFTTELYIDSLDHDLRQQVTSQFLQHELHMLSEHNKVRAPPSLAKAMQLAHMCAASMALQSQSSTMQLHRNYCKIHGPNRGHDTQDCDRYHQGQGNRETGSHRFGSMYTHRSPAMQPLLSTPFPQRNGQGYQTGTQRQGPWAQPQQQFPAAQARGGQASTALPQGRAPQTSSAPPTLPQQYTHTQPHNGTRSSVACNVCGQAGHFARTCPQNTRSFSNARPQGATSSQSTPTSTTRFAAMESSSCSEEEAKGQHEAGSHDEEEDIQEAFADANWQDDAHLESMAADEEVADVDFDSQEASQNVSLFALTTHTPPKEAPTSSHPPRATLTVGGSILCTEPFSPTKLQLAGAESRERLSHNNPFLRLFLACHEKDMLTEARKAFHTPAVKHEFLHKYSEAYKRRKHLEATADYALEESLYADDAQLCVVGTAKASPADPSAYEAIMQDTRPFVPVELDIPGHGKVQVHMLLDTGADKSFLSLGFAEKYKLEYVDTKATVTVATGASFPRRLLQDPLVVNCGKASFSHRFDMAKLPYDGVMGIDTLGKAGMRIHGIPSLFPSQAAAAEQEPPELKEKAFRVSRTQTSLSPVREQLREQCLRRIEEEMKRNADCASAHEFITFPQSDVRIIYEENTKPAYSHPYAAKQEDIPHLQEFLRKNLESGKIREVGADEQVRVNVPIFVVHPPPNTGRKVRVVGDFRKQNEGLRVIPFPIPTVADILQQCNGNTLFSELDLKDAFPQFHIHEEDQLKVAFRLLGKTYAFVGAPLGLVHMSEHCQRVVTTMLQRFQPNVLTYIDNIYPKTDDDMEKHTDLVIAIIRECTDNNVILNPAKCKFLCDKLSILGHTVSAQGVQIDPKKAQQVADWPEPKSAADVMRFMGFVNFLRPNIRGFSMIAAAINALRLTTDKPFVWTAEAADSFQLIKKAVATAPLIHFPCWSKSFTIAIDASNRGVGAVLYQPAAPSDLPEADTVVSFASRALLPYERSYSTYKLELLGLLFALVSYDDFVRGRRFHVLTDNRALSFLLAQQHLNKTQSNWLARIMDFDFSVTHVPGTINWVADCLSRMFTDVWGISPAVSQKSPASIALLTVQRPDAGGTQQIPIPAIVHNTAATAEQAQQIAEAHAFGHYGVTATRNALRRDGKTWPFMLQHIHTALQNCKACQLWTAQKQVFAPLHPLSATHPWDHLQLDLLTSFPKASNGDLYLLVVVDVFSSFALLRALANKRAETIARALWNIFCDFGAPRILQFDNEATLRSAIITSLIETFGASHSSIAAYNPRQNGKVERTIATVAMSIRKLLTQAGGEWPDQVAFAQLGFNNKVREDVGTDPFSIIFNRSLNAFTNYSALPADSPLELEAWSKHQRRIRDMVFPVVADKQRAAQERMRKRFNEEHRTSSIGLLPGTVVMIEDVLRANKNETPFLGPYTVLSAASASSYWLKDAVNSIYHRAVPRQQIKVLSRALPAVVNTSLQRPTVADIVVNESAGGAASSTALPTDQYYVDFIEKHRRRKTGEHEYLMHWVGYDDPSWSVAADIEPNLIQQYHASKTRIPKTKK